MAFLKTKKRQRSQLLFSLFAVLIVVILIVLYIGFFKKDSLPSDSLSFPLEGTEKNVPVLDTSIFDEKSLDAFRPWSVLPLEVGPTGKINPFSQ